MKVWINNKIYDANKDIIFISFDDESIEYILNELSYSNELYFFPENIKLKKESLEKMIQWFQHYLKQN